MNTLTGLIPTIYASMQVVSRELIGFIPAVTMDANLAERAAIGQTIRSPIAPTAVVNDVVASMALPDGDDQALDYVDMQITASKAVQIPYPGEDQLALGPNNTSVFGQQLEQSFRSLANMIEAEVAGHYKESSRAYGTPGTIPFAAGVGDAAQIRKILVDNGARGDLRLVVGTGAGANLRSNTQLTKANEANTDETLRSGTLLDLAGIKIHESAAVITHTPGTAAGWQINNAPGYAVGDNALAVDTGTGAFALGDLITIGGGSNAYSVNAAGVGSVTIGKPGLRNAIADDAAVAVLPEYEANFAFDRSAVQLAVRAPALPDGGDAAVDRTMVVDPVSGLTFEISVYVGYKKKVIEVAAAWGSKVIQPEHTAILAG